MSLAWYQAICRMVLIFVSIYFEWRDTDHENQAIGLRPCQIRTEVSQFFCIIKLTLVMKGNELKLWIASLTTCNLITVQVTVEC